MNIVLLGPPGVGKGTQGERLSALTGNPVISSGDLFRVIRREETPLALRVRHFMDRGEYVPDDLTISIVMRRLMDADTQAGFILDGFPRTIAQAQALEERLSLSNDRIDAALHFTAPEDALMRRIEGRVVCVGCDTVYNLNTKPPRQEGICDACGCALERRTDEAVDVVRARLHTYIRQTEPLVTYYATRGLLSEIDATGSIEQVEARVDEALGLQVRRLVPSA